ncbi:hypothetical protein, partial [Robbsia andropogonis]|uniref:hypothetical protein n=1 Tax=Robbsia andropogonis TaxID=28092 RepID=UPI0020A109AE
SIVNEISRLSSPTPQGGHAPIAAFINAGFQPKNIASMLSGSAENFIANVGNISALVEVPPGQFQSPVAVLNQAGLSTNNIASILS